MNNLRDCRVKKLLTKKDLAKASGVSQTTIAFIENELSEPMDDTKEKLARALGLDLMSKRFFHPSPQRRAGCHQKHNSQRLFHFIVFVPHPSFYI